VKPPGRRLAGSAGMECIDLSRPTLLSFFRDARRAVQMQILDRAEATHPNLPAAAVARPEPVPVPVPALTAGGASHGPGVHRGRWQAVAPRSQIARRLIAQIRRV